MFSAGKSGGVVPTDPYFQDVTLLLTGDGTNGAQNNTFIDSSSNNFTITRNGNTTQGTFSPYGSLWSNYFGGSGDWLNTGANTALSMGTGDFTWECWVNATAQGAYQAFIDSRTSSSGYTDGYFFGLNTGTLTPSVFKNSQVLLASSSIAVNTWNHVALVRASGTLTIYINGTNSGSVSDSTNLTNNTIGITSFPAVAQNRFAGYISNVRIVKGTAVYTSAFTPSTTPLTAISGTSLLTCQSNRFIDNSSNNFALTVNGTPSVQRFSPFQPTSAYSTSVIGGSGYFDGSGDYLSAANNAALSISGGDFTIEGWIYMTANTANNIVVERFAGGTGPGYTIYVASAGGNIVLYGSSTVISGGAIPLNAWTHFAFTRSGTTTYGFVNGVSIGSTSTNITDSAQPLYVGARSGSSLYWNGYIEDLRIIKGTALYTSAFTPPTAPLTAVTNTSLLLNMTNAGIPDAAMMNDLETVGNAQVSTSVKKYGTGSLYFDGSGDYLSAANNSAFNFGTGDFTIEWWMYCSISWTSMTNPGIAGQKAGDGTNGWQIYRNSMNDPTTVNIRITGQSDYTSNAVPTTAVWEHWAVTRSGTTLRWYKNGVLTNTITGVSANISDTTGAMNVGYTQTWGGYFNGYIDDLRITKGYARYTTTFTPPTAALPTY